MADPLLTQSVDQLARATAVSPDALTAVQEPGGPLQSIEVKRLLGRLIQTDTAKPDRPALEADLWHDANSVGLVYSDAMPTNNGWYRKSGASGAGTWTQFEKLSSYVLPLVEQAGADLASGLESINQTVVANGPLRTPGEYGIMDVDATGITSRYVRPDGTQVFGAIETGTLSVSPFPLVDPSVRQAVLDPTGCAFFAVSSDGLLPVDSVDETMFPIIDSSVRLAVLDATGIAYFVIGTDGVAGAAARASTPIGWPYDWYIRLMKNQSLGNGYLAVPARSTTPKYGSLMLSTGLRTANVTDFSAATLIAHVESDVTDPVNSAPAGETPMRISADGLIDRIAIENGISPTDHDFTVISMVTGISGSSIAGISPGTGSDDRARAALTRIAALAQAAGRTAGVASVPWVIGETDTVNQTPVATIIAAMESNRAGIDAFAKATFGQTKDVQLISYQTSSHSGYGVAYPFAALAEWEASKTNANIHVACPIYWADNIDQAHIDAVSEQVLGAYMARCEKAVVVDGNPWKPLQPVSIEVQGKIAVAKFEGAVGDLVFDTSWVADPGNYGLWLVDHSGATIALDTPPAIGVGNTVRFVSALMPAAVELRIGWLPGPAAGGPPWVRSGRLTGPRCCLRDSAGQSDVFDPNGINRPLHNWAVISFVRSAAWTS